MDSKEFDSDKEILAPGSRNRERILFVDDEELFVKMGSRMLELQGYQVIYKTDSEEAFEAFCYQPEKFDLIITDQNMPGMSGMELARKFLDLRPDIPIILCTANDQIPERELTELGIGKFILKPIDSANLVETIREMLDEKQKGQA